MATLIFILLAAVVVSSAVLVVRERNPVYAALFLVLTLLSLAGLYATLGAALIAALQVIVYAGAIMVLFLFVVMLLDSSRSSERPQEASYRGVAALSLALVLLLAVLLALLSGEPVALTREAPAVAGGNTEQVGLALFGRWIYPLEVASALLLAAIVGVVVLAKR